MVVPSRHCDRKMGDSSTPYGQFISVYMPLLKQKYPDMKKHGRFRSQPRSSGRETFEKFPGMERISKQCLVKLFQRQIT